MVLSTAMHTTALAQLNTKRVVCKGSTQNCTSQEIIGGDSHEEISSSHDVLNDVH